MSDSTTSTVYQNSLPPWAEASYKQLLSDADTIFDPSQAYPTYGGQRIAGFDPLQNEAFDMTGNLPSSYDPMFDLADQQTALLGNFGTGVRNGDLYQPRDYENMGFTDEQYAQAMNPYTENVLDRAKARANESFNEQQIGRDQRQAATGSFGGSRRFVENASAQRDMNNTLADLEATQLSQAFQNAQGFLTGQRQLGETSRQFGVGTQLKGADITGMAANLGINAGTQRSRADLSSIDAMLKAGGQKQNLAQTSLDMGYQDFINQRDWPAQNLNAFSAIMRGTPQTQPRAVSTSSSQGEPNVWNQLGGTALAAAGLFK